MVFRLFIYKHNVLKYSHLHKTPLRLAIEKNDVNLAKTLVQYGADFNAQSGYACQIL